MLEIVTVPVQGDAGLLRISGPIAERTLGPAGGPWRCLEVVRSCGGLDVRGNTADRAEHAVLVAHEVMAFGAIQRSEV